MKMAEVAEIMLWSCLSPNKGHDLGFSVKYNNFYLLGKEKYLVINMVDYIRVKTLMKNSLCLKEIGMDW
jgi:hypothetical protein